MLAQELRRRRFSPPEVLSPLAFLERLRLAPLLRPLISIEPSLSSSSTSTCKPICAMADAESSARRGDDGDTSRADAASAGGARAAAPEVEAPHAEASRTEPATNINPTGAADSEDEYADPPKHGDEQHHDEEHEAETGPERGDWQDSRVT